MDAQVYIDEALRHKRLQSMDAYALSAFGTGDKRYLQIHQRRLAHEHTLAAAKAVAHGDEHNANALPLDSNGLTAGAFDGGDDDHDRFATGSGCDGGSGPGQVEPLALTQALPVTPRGANAGRGTDSTPRLRAALNKF